MKKSKKFLAFLLTAVMVVMMIPFDTIAYAEGGSTVTNDQTINIPVEKVWSDGNEKHADDSVEITLYADNEPTDTTLTLNANNEWKDSFKGLPKYREGGSTEIRYSVKEENVPKDYKVSYVDAIPASLSAGNWGIKVTPASNASYILNGNIVVANKGSNYYIWTLVGLTEAQKAEVLVAINAAKLQGLGKSLSMSNTVFQAGLPAYFENDAVIISKSSEEVMNIIFSDTNVWSLFYEGTLTITEGTSCIVTNTYEPTPTKATGSLTVSKTVSGEGASQSDEFTFTVTLNAGAGAVLSSSSNTYGDVTFTNNVATFTLKHGESKTISDLPADFSYTVAESDNSGYTVTVNNTNETTASGTIVAGETAIAAFNNYKAEDIKIEVPETINIPVEKVWSDGNDNHGRDSVEITLYADDEPTNNTLTLNANNQWKDTFEGLLKYREDGKTVISYTVKEVNTPANYKVSYDKLATATSSDESWIVTNTYEEPIPTPIEEPKPTPTEEPKPTPTEVPLPTPVIVEPPVDDSIAVSVNKVWNDDNSNERPDSVTVQLYRDGVAYGNTITLDNSNNWMYIWSNLDNDYTWTVDEVNTPSDYTKNVTNSGNSWTITNEYIMIEVPEDDVPQGNPTPEEVAPPVVIAAPEEVAPPVVIAAPEDIEIPNDVVPQGTILDEAPQTGDNSNMTLWLLLAGGSFLGMLIVAVCSRKRKAYR